LTISIRKEVQPFVPKSFMGIDRNASNVTCGNSKIVLQLNLEKVEKIASTTQSIIRSFRRNDAKIQRKITVKYGRRRKERIRRILHLASKNTEGEGRRESDEYYILRRKP